MSMYVFYNFWFVCFLFVLISGKIHNFLFLKKKQLYIMSDYEDDFDSPSAQRGRGGDAGAAATAAGGRGDDDDSELSSPNSSASPTPEPNRTKNNAAAVSPSSGGSPSRGRNNNNNDDPDMEQPRGGGGSGANASSNQLPPLPPGGVVAAARYPGRQQDIQVVDYLDTSKALVKSNRPVTKPRAPRLADPNVQEQMKHVRKEHRTRNDDRTRSIVARRENERNYLKAQYEFEREKKNAEKVIYQRERAAQWSHRLAASPLGVDLVADSERISEEVEQRDVEERRRRRKADVHRRKIKNEIVVKALAEVPLLDEARRQKREMLEDERRQRALRDVQRVEAVQSRKLRDMHEMAELREKIVEQRQSPGAAASDRFVRRQ
jgi:hypothetical protein